MLKKFHLMNLLISIEVYMDTLIDIKKELPSLDTIEANKYIYSFLFILGMTTQAIIGFKGLILLLGCYFIMKYFSNKKDKVIEKT